MRRRHRIAHRRIWSAMAIILPALLVAALALRQTPPADRPAVPLAGPDVNP